jgi:hypothetical protein
MPQLTTTLPGRPGTGIALILPVVLASYRVTSPIYGTSVVDYCVGSTADPALTGQARMEREILEHRANPFRASDECTHPHLHIMYSNGKKYMVCTPCGMQWEV